MPQSSLSADYQERVYAGVLGKLIGVYLGRPFEGWSHEAISAHWGEIRRYVHEDRNLPLVVADDDITGTFTFIRALLDHGISPDITARQIGQSWLNYIAEGRHILWWGGIGMSTEHTAWLRLASGIEAPRSGSIELNGLAVAEEIGAQIFIDGWAMVAPGNPDLAVRLAREAASVSHDGEAINGAVVIAAMESLAFVEKDIDRLLDAALAYIPAASRIARLIADLRRWHREEPHWRKALALLIEHHGYEHFGTNCPMVSNHGVIILALLYGNGHFDRSMMIVNTCGYDTDCNAGNLACLLGIRGGLGVLGAWRAPVNDRMYLPSADGHWGLRDAATIALEIANIGRVLAGREPSRPKNGARYFFGLPGSTHGFAPSPLCPAETQLATDDGVLLLVSQFPGRRCDAEVATFIPRGDDKSRAYQLTATPALYPGNRVTARVIGAGGNREPVRVNLFVRANQLGEELALHEGPAVTLAPGQAAVLEWQVPDTSGWPIGFVGVSLDGPTGSRLDLDWLTWDGTPSLTFDPPAPGPARDFWSQMFVGSIDVSGYQRTGIFNLIHNRGRGLLHTGAREWRDYRVTATLKACLPCEFALAARVQGLTRYYAFTVRPGNRIDLVRMCHEESILASAAFQWETGRQYEVTLEVNGDALAGFIDGAKVIEARDSASGLETGGIGFVVTEGRIESGPLRIEPIA